MTCIFFFYIINDSCFSFISDICKTEKIDGYPTIKLYSDGNYMADYNEDRKSENFYNFLKNAPVVKEEL